MLWAQDSNWLPEHRIEWRPINRRAFQQSQILLLHNQTLLQSCCRNKIFLLAYVKLFPGIRVFGGRRRRVFKKDSWCGWVVVFKLPGSHAPYKCTEKYRGNGDTGNQKYNDDTHFGFSSPQKYFSRSGKSLTAVSWRNDFSQVKRIILYPRPFSDQIAATKSNQKNGEWATRHQYGCY